MNQARAKPSLDRREVRRLDLPDGSCLLIRPSRRQRAWLVIDSDGRWLGRFRTLADATGAARAYITDLQSCTDRQIAHT